DDTKFSAKEIPCAAEVKTGAQVAVEMPARNADFNSLALALSKKLPRDAAVPKDKEKLAEWQKSRRAKLGEIVKAVDYKVKGIKTGAEEKNGVKATFWQL